MLVAEMVLQIDCVIASEDKFSICKLLLFDWHASF